MDWFGGSVTDAVSEVKSQQKILLVFIVGDDEMSKKMTDTYNDLSVASKLNSDKCVALKLEVNSIPYQQFSQIYPVVVIPSSYFIGKNGHPIEIISGNLEPSALVEKIDKIFQFESQSAAEPQAAEPMDASDATIAAAAAATTTTTTTTITTEEGFSEADLQELTEAEAASLEAVPLEERIQKAKSLLEARRQTKAVEDQEKERMAEQTRRTTGKAIQKAQQSRQENELKEWAQNRAKEKEEERVARERVRAQIAQDRAERAARYQQVKTEESEAEKAKELEKKKLEQEKANREAVMRSTMTRLQFRLPNGTSFTQQFQADAMLSEARDFVLEQMKSQFTSFTLCTTFPRRQFTEANYSETLRDLDLAPSAALLVLPGRAVAISSPEGGTFVNLFWILVSPLLAMWRTITSLFRWNVPPPAPRAETPPPPPTTTTPPPEPQPGPSGLQDADGPAIRRRGPKHPRKFYREGNVYRISNQQKDDDDENNTWNGNSTQQM